MWIDSHFHLDDKRLVNDADAIIERAVKSGVEYMLSISVAMNRVETLINLISPYENLFCTAGTHPNHVADEGEGEVTTEQIITATHHSKVIGIGESGLDYYYDYAPKSLQKQQFLKHIEASRVTQLPLVIHSRSADEDMIEILTSEMRAGEFPALLHCYSSGAKLAACALELGVYFSFSGIITFPKSDELRTILKSIPLDKLLVETDAPYLAPVPHRGMLNEPSYVRYTGEYMAKYLELDPQQFAEHTSNNFRTLFKKFPF